eukprot:1155345-Pelagomonas_calceolata.AAC.3
MGYSRECIPYDSMVFRTNDGAEPPLPPLFNIVEFVDNLPTVQKTGGVKSSEPTLPGMLLSLVLNA